MLNIKSFINPASKKTSINKYYNFTYKTPKWNTVFPCICYKKLIEMKIIYLQDVRGNVTKIFCWRKNKK